jgi:hypothetical protein
MSEARPSRGLSRHTKPRVPRSTAATIRPTGASSACSSRNPASRQQSRNGAGSESQLQSRMVARSRGEELGQLPALPSQQQCCREVLAEPHTGEMATSPQVMRVFVLTRKGLPLMPTSPRRARVLLSQGEAVVAKMRPFTIRPQSGDNRVLGDQGYADGVAGMARRAAKGRAA